MGCLGPAHAGGEPLEGCRPSGREPQGQACHQDRFRGARPVPQGRPTAPEPTAPGTIAASAVSWDLMAGTSWLAPHGCAGRWTTTMRSMLYSRRTPRCGRDCFASSTAAQQEYLLLALRFGRPHSLVGMCEGFRVIAELCCFAGGNGRSASGGSKGHGAVLLRGAGSPWQSDQGQGGIQARAGKSLRAWVVRWCGPPQHGLCTKNMALITSDCGAMCSPIIKWP